MAFQNGTLKEVTPLLKLLSIHLPKQLMLNSTGIPYSKTRLNAFDGCKLPLETTIMSPGLSTMDQKSTTLFMKK